MQNYHICQAIEKVVQTFWGLESCNILVMNVLKYCFVQTFFGERQRILAGFRLKVLPVTNNFCRKVLVTGNILDIVEKIFFEFSVQKSRKCVFLRFIKIAEMCINYLLKNRGKVYYETKNL